MKFPLFWGRFRETLRSQGIRGRVHKISIIAGGDVSVVLRFGMDEPRARELVQGALVELQEVQRVEVQQQRESGSGEA